MIRLVTEFSEHKRDIERQLTANTKNIIEHIIKLMLMTNNDSYNHRKKEIANFLSDIDKIKGSNKFPSKKQLMNWTYYKQKDLLSDNIRMKGKINNIVKYYDIVSDISTIQYIAKTINEFCFLYFDWLTDILSKQGYVNFTDIYNKLDNLMSKYF